MTVGGVFKGILVEVEYCPGVVPNNCWGILLEFMQVSLSLEKKDFNLKVFSKGFLGSCVSSVPPQFLANKGSETYWPADTVEFLIML